jgi:signal transduction histidine kinase
VREEFCLEYRIVRPGGSIRWIRNHGFPVFDSQGVVVRVAGLAVDITSDRAESDRLRETVAQVRALSERMEHGREEQAMQLSRELHGQLGSALTGARWELEWLQERLVEMNARSGEEPLAGRVEGMLRLLDAASKTARRVSLAMRPGLLDDLGLCEALERHGRQFQQQTGIGCRVRAAGEPALGRRRALALFRVLEEALVNVSRHSGASEVEIGLECGPDAVVLSVRDNGRGLGPEDWHRPGTLGLAGMRERARAAGGEVEIQNAPHGGVTVWLRIPTGEVPEAHETDSAD